MSAVSEYFFHRGVRFPLNRGRKQRNILLRFPLRYYIAAGAAALIAGWCIAAWAQPVAETVIKGMIR